MDKQRWINDWGAFRVVKTPGSGDRDPRLEKWVRARVFITTQQSTNCNMSSPSGSKGSEYRTIPVSPEFRKQLRVAKAKEGETYEQFLRKHVSLE